MSILRRIVILVDITLFVWLILQVADTGGIDGGYEWALFLGVLFAIALNILFVVTWKREDDNWVGLFLKRKALEERKKISDLES